MLQEIFLEFSGRIFHAPAWDTKQEDSRKSRRGECNLCAAVADKKQSYGLIERSSTAIAVVKNTKPYAPGHVLLIPTIHRHDLSRLGAQEGSEIFDVVLDVSERIGRNYWIFANVGWVAGQSYHHFHFHVLPDPWHISEEFAEHVERHKTFDPLTDVLTDGIRGKRFYVRYGDGHMSGFIVSDFNEFRRLIGKMRTKFGRMREVLYQQRHAMLERGHMPSMGYHLLVLNYKDPQIVVIPRVFVPKSGRWAVLELLYNADLSRDLRGEDERAFWNVAAPETDRLAERILNV